MDEAKPGTSGACRAALCAARRPVKHHAAISNTRHVSWPRPPAEMPPRPSWISGEESRTGLRTSVVRASVVPGRVNSALHSLRHKCAGQLIACAFHFHSFFRAALTMQTNPIVPFGHGRSTAIWHINKQPTVFMRTSSPGSHPQTAQPRPGTAREHLPRSLPPRASPLPP